MTNLRRFNKTTIHTGDQPGPPSPYVGDRSHTAKMSSGTSKFPVGNAHNQGASELNNRKVNPIGVTDRLTPNGWATDAMLNHLVQGTELTEMMKVKVDLALIIGVDRGPFVK